MDGEILHLWGAAYRVPPPSHHFSFFNRYKQATESYIYEFCFFSVSIVYHRWFEMQKIGNKKLIFSRIPIRRSTWKRLSQIKPSGCSWDLWFRITFFGEKIDNIAGESNEKHDKRKATI